MKFFKKVADAWQNVYTGNGVVPGRKTGKTISVSTLLDEQTLSDLYIDDGIGRKIVDKFVEEALKKGFVVEGDEKSIFKNWYEGNRLEFNGKKLPEIVKQFFVFDRLHGGAGMVLGLDDGQMLDTPLNEDNIRELLFVRPYSRWRIRPDYTVKYDDPNSPKFGSVQRYQITPTNGTPYTVHESRLILKRGKMVPELYETFVDGFGASALQSVFAALTKYASAQESAEDILDDFCTMTITMENLMDLLSTNDMTIIQKRLQLIDQTRSNANAVLLDTLEKFEKSCSSVAGVPDLLDRFEKAVSAAAGMPGRLLFGSQNGGLNNNGEGETSDWYDTLASAQESEYKPVIEKLVRAVLLCRKGPFRGKELQEWLIKFPPLKQLTEKEQAEVQKINADADCAYVNAGVLQPEEVAISRFAGQEYGKSIILESESIEDRKTEAEEEVGAEE